MSELENLRKDYERVRRRSRMMRAALVVASVSVMVAVVSGFELAHRRLREREAARIEAENRVRHAESAVRRRLQEMEDVRQRRISDSIARANAPRYGMADIERMTRARVPSYSWIYLWRKDRDSWLMNYMREYGGREHWFMRRFNPTTEEFGPEIEYCTVRWPDLAGDPVGRDLPNARCRFTKENRGIELVLYEEDGVSYGWYDTSDRRYRYSVASTSRSPLARQRIAALRSSAPDWAEDGYESAEDWYYDNEEDLLFD